MNLFTQLHEATVRAQSECELPDCLAERLLSVAANPDCFPDAAGEVQVLLDMLPDYDTYGQTGYIGMGVSNGILEGAIGRLEKKRR
jgi:hypothetical protein